MILDELELGDEIELMGMRMIVTNKTKNYCVGVQDGSGCVHYLRRETPILKIIKRGDHAKNKN